MIWTAGRIVADDELKVSVLDRTFEHGLGLFETFRTWNEHATTLPDHCERMQESATELNLPQPRSDELPTESDVLALRDAAGFSGDAMFRLTMSGGSDRARPVIWMRIAPLPTQPENGAVIRSRWLIDDEDGGSRRLSEHKTLNYWRRRMLYEAAREAGYDEDIGTRNSIRPHIGPAPAYVYEGTRTNIFLIKDNVLHAPPGGLIFHPRIVRGIMRGTVIRHALHLMLELKAGLRFAGDYEFEPDVEEQTLDHLFDADEVFLTNAVRGILPVRRFDHILLSNPDAFREYEAPGPWTRRLWHSVRTALEAGRIKP
jgi:branched-subunit amino acid aminotransferase/4-amino-4-deoxychorismate lyase